MTLYPIVTAIGGRQFFDSLDPSGWARLTPTIEELDVEWISGGVVVAGAAEDRFDVRPLYALARRAMQAVERGEFTGGANPRDRFEAEYALPLHRLLHDVPGAVLTDRGFWRFLSLGPFFAATVWRQQDRNLTTAFGLPPSSGRRRASDSANLARILPWRLYMRAEIGGSEEYVTISGADLWWSHPFRVHIGRSPVTARAFLREVGREPVSVQRALAPGVTADRGRRTYDALDGEEIAALVHAARARLQTRETSDDASDDPALDEDESS